MHFVRAFFIFSICFLPAMVLAQDALFSHQKWYRVEDGLPQSFVVEIHQDVQGFIWVATRDGLARFDGQQFKIWRNDPNDPRTLASNVVMEMFQTNNGKFIITYQGNLVDEFDPETGKVRHLSEEKATSRFFKKARRIIYPRQDQWFFHEEFNRGLGRIDLKKEPQEILYNSSNVLKHGDSIVGSVLQPNGILWMVSPEGIYKMDSGAVNVDWFPFAEKQNLGKPYRVRSAEVFLAWDEWLAISALDALYFWNTKTAALKKFSFETNTATQFRFPDHFQKDPSGAFYFRYGAGVYRIDSSLQAPELVWKNHLVSGRAITGCMVDKSGTLWVGIDAAGLVKVNLKTMPFASKNYTNNFHQTILELEGFPASAIPPRWTDPRYGSYYFRYGYSPQNELYLTYSFGTPIGNRDLYTMQKQKLMPLPMPSGASDSYFRGISFDASGGIFGYKENGHQLYYWKDKNNQPEVVSLKSLPQHGTYDIADAKMIDGVLWLSTYGEGLLQIKDDKLLKHYKAKNAGNFHVPDNLTVINPDPTSPNIIWVGSLGGGLIKMHKTDGILEILTMDNGLPNNTIYCMENDSTGNIWLSTNNGLLRFTPKTGAMHVFYKSDGLPGNEFNRSHSYRLRDGRLAFGGPDGLVVFNPEDYKPVTEIYPTRLTITGIEINGKALNDLDDTTLLGHLPLSKIKKIALAYDQNYLSVSFASLLFNEPQKIKYRYRLLPDEKTWNESGNQAFARYTQLSPGTYTLELNATGVDGKWSDEIRKLAIKIHPPFWNTWYARAFYMLATVGLVIIFLKSRLRNLRARQQVAFEQREAERLRELDKMKETFFANITHELRTPLTLIKTPLDALAMDETLPAPARKTIDTARRNSQSLLRLINQLLDINKLESGQMKILETVGEPVIFLYQCIEPFQQTALAKNIRFETIMEGMEGSWLFDSDKWEKIIYNLLSNAIKFTPEGGEIRFLMKEYAESEEKSGVHLVVEDSGIGMEADELERIFDRFYQVQSGTLQYTGTGIGLSLVKELVQLMGGSIRAKSQPGVGTSISVLLPASKTSVASVTAVQVYATASAYDQPMEVKNVESGEKVSFTNDITLLIAEDNDDLRAFLKESLEKNYRLQIVSNGREAWQQSKANLPDLVITDMMMPEMDGSELCRNLKENPHTNHIPLIMLTSRTAAEARITGRGAGADVYLTKPFDMEELKLCVRNLLEQQERQRTHWQQQMASSLPRVPGPTDEFTGNLYRFMDEHLDDTNLGVDTLAGEMGMSKSTLNRKLQSIMGVSTNDFIRQYRLKKAATFLVAGYDAAGAAYKSGFSSPSYFSQKFREFFGKTPTEYASQAHLTQN